MKNNTVQLRISNQDLYNYYHKQPDRHRKALELYKMKEEGFLAEYVKEEEEWKLALWWWLKI